MATENASWRPRSPPARRSSATLPASRTSRILCRFLVSLGAQIEGIESNVLRIHEVDRLGGGEWRICPEHIEVGSFIGLAAVTGGDITIDDVEPKDLGAMLPTLGRLGVHIEVDGRTLRVPPGQKLVIRDDPRRPDTQGRGRARGPRSRPT